MQTMKIGVGTPIQKAYNKKKCSNCGAKYDIINAELQNYINGNIVWKKEDIAYCHNCNEFFFRSDYDSFIYRHPGYFDYKLVKHVKEKIEAEEKQKEIIIDSLELKEETAKLNLEQTELELDSTQTELIFDRTALEKKDNNDDNQKSQEKQINNEEEKDKIKNEINLPKVDFFVRASINSCSKKKHRIIDLIAEVDVICPNGTIIKKSFHASYCEECKLYFMYENDYKLIRRSGVPLCSIYEYSKYIKINKNKKIELKPESLLHSFGYNVGVTDNLSTNQRRKILLFVINKGIMTKHEIMNLLNYFIDFRKKDKRQAKAILKWQMDIDYIQNIDIKTDKKVEINSIRVINIIKN